MNRKKILKWFKVAVVIYVVIGIALYFLQEQFLFHPKKLNADHKFNFSQPFEETNIEVNRDKIINIIQFKTAMAPKGVVLYFHGNKQNIERYAPFSQHFTRNNYEVWMIDYPGFGKTTGELSEESLYEDAKLFYKLANSRFSKDSIIIYGKSLGTGIATHLAAYRDCRQLILETPFTNMADVMRSFVFLYPTSVMTKYEFPTLSNLDKIQVPVSIFHGTKDELIPYRLSVKLKKHFPGIDLNTIEKGKHNNLADFPLFHSKLDSILSR